MGPSHSSKPTMIGIAGPSGSGKTSIARQVAAELSAIIFSLDNYYHDLSNIPQGERGGHNFDHPESLDGPLIVKHLVALADGKAIDRPIYDFRTHSRTDRFERIEPVPFIIVEGLFSLHWPEVRPVYHAKIFVDAAHDVCLPRRKARDMAERGRTEDSILKQYAETVQPMAEQFVIPTRQFADLVLSGSHPVPDNARRVLDLLKKK